MTLSDRGVLITGVKRIGAVVATSLARAGADVVLAFHRSQAEALSTVGEITALGRRGFAIQANLAERDACRQLVDEAARLLGRLDVLVNMASVYVAKPYDALTDADWDAAIDVDLRASHLCTPRRRALHASPGWGTRDQLLGLDRGERPAAVHGYLPYYVAKAGVIGLTEVLALELAKDGVLVNAVAPGPMLPPQGISDEESRAVITATPLGRWGGEAEIAKAVLFLIESDFITGEVLRVDGGRHVR